MSDTYEALLNIQEPLGKWEVPVLWGKDSSGRSLSLFVSNLNLITYPAHTIIISTNVCRGTNGFEHQLHQRYWLVTERITCGVIFSHPQSNFLPPEQKRRKISQTELSEKKEGYVWIIDLTFKVLEIPSVVSPAMQTDAHDYLYLYLSSFKEPHSVLIKVSLIISLCPDEQCHKTLLLVSLFQLRQHEDFVHLL
jgi:hypothetical protein